MSIAVFRIIAQLSLTLVSGLHICILHSYLLFAYQQSCAIPYYRSSSPTTKSIVPTATTISASSAENPDEHAKHIEETAVWHVEEICCLKIREAMEIAKLHTVPLGVKVHDAPEVPAISPNP